MRARLYRDASGELRFAGKHREAERVTARLILARRRRAHERLFAQNMELLGEPTVGGPCEVMRAVGDENEEVLWRAWRTYCP